MFALVDGNSFYATCEQVFDLDARRRPVVVLSNNDGCIVAASREAKALGCEMFKPYFQIKPQLAGHNVKVFSSNYTLYDDFQRRLVMIYQDHAEEVEIYSIDEAFLTIGPLPDDDLADWGRELRREALQHTGIATGIGIAPTKTLAKLANHLAKRDPIPGQPENVCVLTNPALIDQALARTDLGDIWGINHRNIKRLAKLGITTPLELKNADPNRVREHMTVVGQRMVYELCGEPTLSLEPVRPDRKMICCSRSFDKASNRLDVLTEAMATFVGVAAFKLRCQDQAAAGVVAFVQTDRHKPVEQYQASHAARLTVATEDTRELARVAAWCLRRIYRPQHGIKKAGVLLTHLCKRDARQPGLFDTRDHQQTRRLMATIDTINRRQGRNTIRIAAASPLELKPCRTWHLRSDHRSPRWTTRWDELPVAYARRINPCATATSSAPASTTSATASA
jgi:DNA polymerase V